MWFSMVFSVPVFQLLRERIFEVESMSSEFIEMLYVFRRIEACLESRDHEGLIAVFYLEGMFKGGDAQVHIDGFILIQDIKGLFKLDYPGFFI